MRCRAGVHLGPARSIEDSLLLTECAPMSREGFAAIRKSSWMSRGKSRSVPLNSTRPVGDNIAFHRGKFRGKRGPQNRGFRRPGTRSRNDGLTLALSALTSCLRPVSKRGAKTTGALLPRGSSASIGFFSSSARMKPTRRMRSPQYAQLDLCTDLRRSAPCSRLADATA